MRMGAKIEYLLIRLKAAEQGEKKWAQGVNVRIDEARELLPPSFSVFLSSYLPLTAFQIERCWPTMLK